MLMLIGAHHDDNELLAGLITQYRRRDRRVVSVVVTDGRYAAQQSLESNIALREAESRAAADLLDIETVFLRFTEGGLRATDELCLKLVRLIREYRPTSVVTHPPRDYHTDHEAASASVRDAVMRCQNPTYDDATQPCDRTPSLFFCDAWFVPFDPDVFVDVSDLMEIKAKALRAHRSQLPPDADDPNSMVSLEAVRARYRGIQSGLGHAEAFRRAVLPGQGRVTKLLE